MLSSFFFFFLFILCISTWQHKEGSQPQLWWVCANNMTPSLSYHFQGVDRTNNWVLAFNYFLLPPLLSHDILLLTQPLLLLSVAEELHSKLFLYFSEQRLSVIKLFYMNSKMTESWCALFRYTYSLKIYQTNTPFSSVLLRSFNPQSNKFGSNISLSALTDKKMDSL